MNCFSMVVHRHNFCLDNACFIDNREFEIAGVFFKRSEKGTLSLVNTTHQEKVVILPLYHITQKECTHTYIIPAKEKKDFEKINFNALCLDKIAVYDTNRLTSDGIRGLAGGAGMKSVIIVIPTLTVEGAAYTRTKSGFTVKATTTGIMIYPQQNKEIKIGHVQLSFSSQGVGYSNNTKVHNKAHKKSDYVMLNFPKHLPQGVILYNINIMLDVYPECYEIALGIEP